MAKNTVNIHGKEYETVASRVQRFREKHPDLTLKTEIIHRDETEVVMLATIGQYFSGTHVEGQFHVIATGHAEEQRQSSQINRTSALENAETSAIGRALAAFGMAGTEFASADEVAQAIGQRAKPLGRFSEPDEGPRTKPAVGTEPELATPLQKKQITAFMRAQGVEDNDIATRLITDFGLDPKKLTKADAARVLKELQ